MAAAPKPAALNPESRNPKAEGSPKSEDRKGRARVTLLIAGTAVGSELRLAAWAILGAWFRPSGVLAHPVGPSEPTTARTLYVNAPLRATHAGELQLLSHSKRFSLLFSEIRSYLDDLRTLNQPRAKYLHRSLTGSKPNTRRRELLQARFCPAPFMNQLAYAMPRGDGLRCPRRVRGWGGSRFRRATSLKDFLNHKASATPPFVACACVRSE